LIKSYKTVNFYISITYGAAEMENEIYDFIIIGSGPAGYSAAIEAAQQGKRIVIVEQESVVGGVCINTGTFPSKTLREAVLQLTRFHQKEIYNIPCDERPNVSMQNLKDRLNYVRTQEHRIIEHQFDKNKVHLVYGTASFLSANQVQVNGSNGQEHILEGRYIILATGSKPRRPGDIDFDDEYILDSKTLLDITEIPKTLGIIGGGVIGTEYATIFAALGVKVFLLDKGDRLLKFLDEEIGEYLKTHFPNNNVEYIPNRGYINIQRHDDKVRVMMDNDQIIECERLLFALGRISNTDHLNLSKVGVALNEFRYIQVNELYQTSVPNIYAVGDVIGWPSLAATAITQGRLAVLQALKKKHSDFPELFPFGIYTIPEISYMGLTEEQTREENMNCVVGRSDYTELPRGQISGETTGLLKLIVHFDTREILGAHIIGPGATEIIHIVQVAMQHHAKADLFAENIFNYPTYSEALKIAALDALNNISIRKRGNKKV
jgi:NAD(P) transhydrogenase